MMNPTLMSVAALLASVGIAVASTDNALTTDATPGQTPTPMQAEITEVKKPTYLPVVTPEIAEADKEIEGPLTPITVSADADGTLVAEPKTKASF